MESQPTVTHPQIGNMERSKIRRLIAYRSRTLDKMKNQFLFLHKLERDSLS